jgi:hypothetical protein
MGYSIRWATSDRLALFDSRPMALDFSQFRQGQFRRQSDVDELEALAHYPNFPHLHSIGIKQLPNMLASSFQPG